MKQPLRTLVLALCCGLAAACTQRPERLKLMSYNIRNGIGIDNIQDIGRIAQVILREAPDLVALQELDSATLRVDGRYIPGELGRMTGMHATFGRAIGFAGGSYGVGLLSRTEPLAVRSIPLPGREEARVLLMAEFPDYTVCVTHLSLTPEDRHASLPLILQATDTCRKPVLLAGDFNEPSHLDWTDATCGMWDHNGCVVPWDCSVRLYDAGFRDVYRVLHPDPATHPGFTYPADNPATAVEKLTWAPDADERDRIDFIYYLPGGVFVPKRVEVVGPSSSIVRRSFSLFLARVSLSVSIRAISSRPALISAASEPSFA